MATGTMPAALAALDRWGGGAEPSEQEGDRLPRFDASTVVAGQELTWLEQLERTQAHGPDPALANLDDGALVAELGAQASRVAAATCRYLQLVAELVVRGVWADQGARTPAQWLSFEAGVGASTAAEHRPVAGRGGGRVAGGEDESAPLWHHERTTGSRLADAIVQALAAAVEAGGPDTTGMDRHTLVLQTPERSLQPVEPSHSGRSEPQPQPDRQVAVVDPRGTVRSMSARSLHRLACEASVVVAITDDGGTPLDLGRRTRDPSAAQRRALLLRDRSCRFPGCGSPRHLHAHHVQFWSKGGPTDLSNLVTVCSFHHRFVHDHGWRVERAASGTFRFGPPDRPPLPSVRRLAEADDAWWFDPDQGRPLRPVHRDGPEDLDLDAAVAILHQERRLAIGDDLDLAA